MTTENPAPAEKTVTEETTSEITKNVPVRTALKAGADGDADTSWWNRYSLYGCDPR